MIFKVDDEQAAFLGEPGKVLCWLRVVPHHYGLYVEAFAEKPTEQTSTYKAFARLDVDAFSNVLKVIAATEQQLEQDKMSPEWVVVEDIAQAKKEQADAETS